MTPLHWSIRTNILVANGRKSDANARKRNTRNAKKNINIMFMNIRKNMKNNASKFKCQNVTQKFTNSVVMKTNKFVNILTNNNALMKKKCNVQLHTIKSANKLMIISRVAKIFHNNLVSMLRSGQNWFSSFINITI